MKKLVFLFSLILSYTIIGFTGVSTTPVLADEFSNGNIVTITPSPDSEKIQFGLTFLEYLRQGGSVDFSNSSDDYTVDDFIDEFNDLYNDLVSDMPKPLDDLLANYETNIKLSPNYNLKNYIGVFRKNLPSYINNQPVTPSPTPSPDPNYYEWCSMIQSSNKGSYNNNISLVSYPYYCSNAPGDNYLVTLDTPCSFYCSGGMSNFDSNTNFTLYSFDVITINYNSISKIATYSNYSNGKFYYNNLYKNKIRNIHFDTINNCWVNNFYVPTNDTLTFNTSFADINTFIDYVYRNFRYVNVYVDGALWCYADNTINYSVGLGTGTYIKETNYPVEYKFNVDVYFDLDDLIDKIDLYIDNKVQVEFPDFSDLIIDVNGQQAFAVTIISEEFTLDDQYIKEYGTMIPIFPLWVDYPVSLSDINTVATVGIVNVIPQDIIEIFSLFFITMLLVFICHRLME